MEQMDHQNIVKLYEVYEDDTNFYLIMDYLRGGELYNEIVRRSYFNEREGAIIMFQVFCAINYFHQKGFIHRDLKPENICIEKDINIKLIDFGTVRKFTPGKWLKQSIGTPFYMAPEIFNDNRYNEKADMWSLGIVLYILLTGKSPYYGRDDDVIIAQAKNAKYNRSMLQHKNLSKQAVNLIEALLNKDPSQRLSAEQALRNPWIQKHV
jgi:calcium-dependent protein kinase